MSDSSPTDRRGFLLGGLKSLGRFMAEAVSEGVVKAGGGKRYLRPPGAVEEAAFLLSCTRCGDCAKVCPQQCIKFLPATAGAAVGTPYIDPMEAACTLCGKCMPACEPKALQVIEEPRQVRIGTAVLKTDSCWAFKGQMCDICYQRCPFPDEAIRLVKLKPQIVAEACTGCGLCAYVCVSTPGSIEIQPRK